MNFLLCSFKSTASSSRELALFRPVGRGSVLEESNTYADTADAFVTRLFSSLATVMPAPSGGGRGPKTGKLRSTLST